MHDLTGLGLSTGASAAYRAFLHGRPAPAADDPLSAELEAAGLVHRGPDGEVLPNSPRRAADRWARQQESLIRDVRDVAEQWESLFRSTEGKGVAAEVITGVPAVARACADVQGAARTQIRCTDRGPYLPAREHSPGPAQLAAMGAGVAYLVIYDDEAFQQADLREEIYRGDRGRGTVTGAPRGPGQDAHRRRDDGDGRPPPAGPRA